MQVRMGVDNMVRMVKSTATPSVVQEMRNSYFLEAIAGIDTGVKNMKKIRSY